MTARPVTRSTVARLHAWDHSDGVPPAELLAEYNEELGAPLGWATIDGDIDFGAYHMNFGAYHGEDTDSWYLLAGGPRPTHEHVRGRHLPLCCQYEKHPDLECQMPPDHPVHRPDLPIEVWEWADIIERYGWPHGLYLLAGGR